MTKPTISEIEDFRYKIYVLPEQEKCKQVVGDTICQRMRVYDILTRTAGFTKTQLDCLVKFTGGWV